jgi:hypothetical protein
MTIEGLRTTLEELESNYEMARRFRAYPLVEALRDQILMVQDALVKAIVAEDPYTTEADVRFFEGFPAEGRKGFY